jgi:hypothetical protein
MTSTRSLTHLLLIVAVAMVTVEVPLHHHRLPLLLNRLRKKVPPLNLAVKAIFPFLHPIMLQRLKHQCESITNKIYYFYVPQALTRMIYLGKLI